MSTNVLLNSNMKLYEVAKKYTHEVVDDKGTIVGRYTSVKSAYRGADKHDNAYGASIHTVKPIKHK